MIDSSALSTTMCRAQRLVVVAALVFAGAAGAATGPESSDEQRHLIEILEQLEHGMAALDTLGRREEMRMLRRVAEDVRREIRHQRPDERRRPNRELEIAAMQIEALALALPALREAERMDAVEMAERAIQARELSLEGRRDLEARRIREHAPNREQTLEVLGLAIELYQAFDAHDRAEHLANLTRELWPKGKRPRRRVEQHPEAAIHELEVMGMAMHGLLEAQKHDAADQLKWAIRAREVTLEQRRDDEAHAIRQRAPSLGQQVELLQFAAGWWDEFGHEEKARVIRETAERLWAHRPREGRPQRHADPIERRISALERQLAELLHTLDALQNDLERRSR